MKKLIELIIGFLVLNIIWWLGSVSMNSPIMPSPIAVYRDFPELLISGGLLLQIGASLWRLFAGLALAMIVGVIVGLLMSYSSWVGKILSPLVYFSYPIPKTALLPIAMLLLGLGDGSKILIMFLTTVFQVIVSTRDSVVSLDDSIYRVAISSGATKSYILKNITLPAIVPSLFTSTRVSIGTGLAILIIVEAYGTRLGLGYFIMDSWARLNYIQMYSGIVTIAVVGCLLFLALDLLPKVVCPWMYKK